VSSRAAALLARLREALADRLFPRPIATADDLARFVGQRAALVAQTSLFGYLKTRMGTSFPRYFEDDAFSQVIRTAAVRLFVSCASDLSVHAVALAGDGRLDRSASEGLARHCFAGALAEALPDADAAPPGAAADFDARAGRTAWASAARGEAAFAGSVQDLVRHAPVIDAFKDADAPIVFNSIRFRWREVRAQLRRRLDAEAVCADWLARHP
jgi:hypothetical protein